MGLRDILALPVMYAGLQRVLGGRSHEVFVREYVKPKPNDRILDIGCGPGRIVSTLPKDVRYIGVDGSPRYIEDAKRRYGASATFLCGKVGAELAHDLGKFEIVLAMGLLHHLDDAEALQLFRCALDALTPSGRLVTIDGCYTTRQNPIARLLLKWDRGEFVRSPSAYAKLAEHAFDDVQTFVRHDLLRVPYTHAILECSP